MSIADLRREYNLTGLRRKDLHPDPLIQFNIWFDQLSGARTSGRLWKFFVRLYKSVLLIKAAEQVDLNAMTLATADEQGQPSARVVLLKGLDERGFVFYSNYHSQKARDLENNPHAALGFYWPMLERQVGVRGSISRLTPSESDAYFNTRPRGSRIAAWASDQGNPVTDRGQLEKQWREIEERFQAQEVPRPPHWGGFLLTPAQMEFWQGRPNRLHDRFRYTRREDNGWTLERLSP